MSGDYNMNQTSPGWRKRQIALDKKAENARELGLDYEPSIIEMARRAGAVFPADGSYHKFERHEDLEAFAKLVDAQATAREREACAKVCDDRAFRFFSESPFFVEMHGLADAIRARGQA